ncbi:MAG: fructose-bisphosphate aldolase class I, partial [bacterium]|nr:fructose-bisphosphate aldolase class I [bacterium]
SEENRRAYRELLITAPGLEEYISGIIFYDETIRQSAKDGKSFYAILQSKGIDVGIKVDQGLKDFPPFEGEQKTQGLEGLKGRLEEYKTMGATFAKWRAVYKIGEGTPSVLLMEENAKILAEYARVCQELDIVPIIEPEVLIEGEHSIDQCYEATAKNLDILFAEFVKENIFLPGAILKTSMVISGKGAQNRAVPEQVAEMTLKCLKEHVPKNIGGVVFLSGGQNEEESVVHLNLMHQKGELPWNLTFSYSRAIQNPVLKYWSENMEDIKGAQELLLERAKGNSLASVGEYK